MMPINGNRRIIFLTTQIVAVARPAEWVPAQPGFRSLLLSCVLRFELFTHWRPIQSWVLIKQSWYQDHSFAPYPGIHQRIHERMSTKGVLVQFLKSFPKFFLNVKKLPHPKRQQMWCRVQVVCSQFSFRCVDEQRSQMAIQRFLFHLTISTFSALEPEQKKRRNDDDVFH